MTNRQAYFFIGMLSWVGSLVLYPSTEHIPARLIFSVLMWGVWSLTYLFFKK